MDINDIMRNKRELIEKVGLCQQNFFYFNNPLPQLGLIKILIVINCILITFSKVIACNCNLDISLITVIECN